MTNVDPDDRQLLSTPTRQSPVAVVFMALKFVRNLGAVNLVFFLVVLGSGRLPFALLGVGVAASVALLAYTVAAWWRFVFTIEGDELLVAKGVVAQERLTIPLDRVQSVSINQRFLHRLIGLVSVSVDTAGSSDAELEIDAVDRGRAEALQRLAAGHRQIPAPGVVGPPPGSAGGQGTEGAGPGPTGPWPAGTVPTGTWPEGQPPPPGTTIGPDGLPVAAAPPPPFTEQTLVTRTPIELVKIGLARWPWAGLAALAPLFALAGEFGDLLPIDIDGEQLIEDNLPDEVGRALVTAVIGFILIGLFIGAVIGVLLLVTQGL
ncbi:MAG: PH domain-containing protein, partial [Actinomycetota bacterium]